MPPPIALGSSDFRKLREHGHLYVDRTDWVRDVVMSGAEVLLFTRPRRFGKSLNLSTLQTFIERNDEDLSRLFTGLAIWDSPARAAFQQHPVISLSLKDIKGLTWADAWESLRAVLRAAAHHLARHSPPTDPFDLEELRRLRADEASPAEWRGCLRSFTRWAHEATGRRAWVLIDEYDAPVHAGWLNGWHDEIVAFLRELFGSGLKDNRHLDHAVLTGVLRVAKTGMFSDLNNLQVYSIFDTRYATAFGFAESEVEALRVAAQSPHTLDTLRDWYNGYTLGGNTIYNPWSILACLANPEEAPRCWWAGTGSFDLYARRLLGGTETFLDDLETLLQGGEIRKRISDLVLFDRSQTQDAWALLLHGGYLTATSTVPAGAGWMTQLRVPNRDVHGALAELVQIYLQDKLAGAGDLLALCEALLGGHAERLSTLLGHFVQHALSVRDFGVDQPEKVYQAFMLGLLVQLESTHAVRSERESGGGYADILVIPRRPGTPGAVIEIKRSRGPRGFKAAIRAAHEQIITRGYRRELEAAGASPIWSWGIAFDGKSLAVGVRE